MRALTWQGKRKVEVIDVPDPKIEKPTDAIVKITSTAICGSDLHLYEVLGPYLKAGDVLGHEPLGIVEEVGADVSHIQPGDRVVIPFNISCGSCWMCSRQLYAQCETTQNHRPVRAPRCSATPACTARCPAARRSTCAFPKRIRTGQGPEGAPDERYLYLSDVCRPPGRPWPTPTCHRRHAGGARPRADRHDGHPDRGVPRRQADHRRGPRAGAARQGASARHRDSRSALGGSHAVTPWQDADRADRGTGAGRRRSRRSGWRRTARRSASCAHTAVGLLPDALARPMIDKAARGPDERAARRR